MPELPEVETIKRDLSSSLTGKIIENVFIHDLRVLTGFAPNGNQRRRVSPSQFKKNVIGKKILNMSRRGKYLIMEFENQAGLLFHLRMTGQLLLENHCSNARAVFQFKNQGSLSFSDRRRFGEIIYSNNWKNENCILSLGPEPLGGELTADYLKDQFRCKTSSIHSMLLNQKILAGVGNIYAAEALFRSAIKPFRSAGRVPFRKLESLVHAIKDVLQKSIDNRGYSMNTYVDALGKKGKSQLFTVVYGKEGNPCSVCRKILKKKTISGRGVVFCGQCQN